MSNLKHVVFIPKYRKKVLYAVSQVIGYIKRWPTRIWAALTASFSRYERLRK